MYLHLEWQYLARLALRLRTIATQLNQGYPQEWFLSDKNILDIFENLASIEKLVIKDNSNIGATSQMPLLDEKFELIANDLNRYSNQVKAGNASKFLNALNNDLKTPICKSCTQSPCEWSTTSRNNDEENLKTSGKCIAPLTEMFVFATHIANEIYTQLGNNASCPSDTRLSTAHIHTRNDELNLAISASISENRLRSNSKFQRDVKIKFFLDEFKLGDYLAMLYVVFHEVFVHGWCGIDIGGGTSTQSEGFHDGWMDYIAVHMLNQSLINLKNDDFQSIAVYKDLFVNRLAEVNKSRMDFYRPNRCPNVFVWAKGASAAETLRQIFAKAIEDNNTAEQLFFSFSIELNCSNASDTLRYSLVENICSHYHRQNDISRGQALVDKPIVVDYILEYANTKNAVKLAEAIVSI